MVWIILYLVAAILGALFVAGAAIRTEEPHLTLEGKACFSCGRPATLWRTYKCPILPWCEQCQFELLYGRPAK